MKDIQELAPDAETFRRVWQRVMPDQTLSQIVLDTGEEKTPRVRKTDERAGEEDILAGMLRRTEEAMAAAGEMRRRRSDARPLWDSLNRTDARLRSAWFLRTGRRWDPGQMIPLRAGETGQLLRRMYLGELEFSRLCRALERDGEDGAELAEGLPEESAKRRGMIRRMLL